MVSLQLVEKHLPKNHGPKINSQNTLFPELAIVRNHSYLNKHLPEVAFPRKLIFQKLQLPDCYIWPKLRYIFPKTYFPQFTPIRICNWQKTCFQEFTFGRTYISRKLIFQNLHLPEFTFCQNCICPKTYFPEFTLVENCSWQKLHFRESMFSRNSIFSRKLILKTLSFFEKLCRIFAGYF